MPMHFPKMPWWVFIVHMLGYLTTVCYVAVTGPTVAFAVFLAVFGAGWWIILYGDEVPWRTDG